MPSEQLRQFIEYQKGPFIPCGRKKSPGIPEFLLNSHRDGKTLTFQLSHRHAYTNTSADPPVTFRLDLVGPDEANLVRIPKTARRMCVWFERSSTQGNPSTPKDENCCPSRDLRLSPL